MIMKMASRITLVSVLSMAWAAHAHAECVRTLETKVQRFARTTLVFYGTVLKVETVIQDPEPFVYRVRFRVDQPYKGTTAGEQTFDFGATAEDFIFKEGQQVLVWAPLNQHGQFTTQCTATRTTTLDDSELIELRNFSVDSLLR
jgi:hypothetical protein